MSRAGCPARPLVIVLGSVALGMATGTLGGCATNKEMAIQSSDLGTPAPSDTAGFTFPQILLQVDLSPSRLRESGSDAFRVLPQAVTSTVRQDAIGVNLGDVVLQRPVVQTGTIVGFRVNPTVAALPGASLPITGDVHLHLGDSVQSYFTRTDALGRFTTWAVPGAGYRFEITPDDPLMPVYATTLDVTDPSQPVDLDLGPGVPVYGQVTSLRGPLSGAHVQLVDDHGAISAAAVTDDFGLYQVRAVPGKWNVVCTGRAGGKDPTLTFSDLTVDDDGLLLDIGYPSALDPAFVEGEAASEAGGDLSFATVRLVAESLDGYEGLTASWSYEAFITGNAFLSPVVPGVYTMEVLPPDSPEGDGLSPLRLTGLAMGPGSNPLDPVVLDGLVPVSGEVRGPSANPIVSARVVCDEVGFGQRTWETFSDVQGHFGIELPAVPVSCEAHAPGDREQLAIQRITLDPSVDDSLGFDLDAGQIVSGTVSTVEEGPEAYVVVEIRDGSDHVLGTGITGADGQFTIPVDLYSVE